MGHTDYESRVEASTGEQLPCVLCGTLTDGRWIRGQAVFPHCSSCPPPMPPFPTPLPVHDAEFLKEWGPQLGRDQARVRRNRQVLRLTLALRSRAERFCLGVEELKRPDYWLAGAMLRCYCQGHLGEDELCRVLTQRLASSPRPPWELRPVYRGQVSPRSGPRFELDRGDGALDPWRHLALLLEDGATLGRFRVCALPDCHRLFYDASPNALRRACSEQHQRRLYMREYRSTASRRARRDAHTTGRVNG